MRNSDHLQSIFGRESCSRVTESRGDVRGFSSTEGRAKENGKGEKAENLSDSFDDLIRSA